MPNTGIIFSGFRALAVLAALALSACGDNNPLIGTWKLDKSSAKTYYDRELLKAVGNDIIVFEEGRVVSGDKAMAVSYSVSGNDVTVMYNHSGDSNTYTIINNNHFFVEMDKLGNLKYVREARN